MNVGTLSTTIPFGVPFSCRRSDVTDEQDPYAPPPEGGAAQPGQAPDYGQPQFGQPQFGQPQVGQPPYGYPPSRQAGTNGFAIAALVCAFVCSPLGIVFGFVARGQIRRTGQGGDGLALAGIILSVVFLVLGIVVTLGRS
jgi:hypothetical protein